jgi:H(+)-transporting ATP synthase, vacuolar type, subunit D
MKQVNPTRMELTRLKQRLVTARRGHKLLKDKRDELMRRFLELVRENGRLRKETEAALAISAKKFALARAMMQSPMIDTALLAPSQQVTVEYGTKNVMSVTVPEFTFNTRSADESSMYSYGLSFTSADLDDAVKNLSEVLPQLLKLAEVEKSCQLMAAEIEKTRRRVNALEYMVIPELQETIRSIVMKLDENERSGQVRLMKVKDMMIEKARM